MTDIAPAGTDLLVDRADVSHVRIADADRVPAVPGQVVVRIDRVALTANNVTYAALGDVLSYWQFFSDTTPEGWGRLPAWGIGEVVDSGLAEDLPTGTRVYGYLPVATHVVLTPDRIGSHGFVDRSPHREGLAAVYQQYRILDADVTDAAVDRMAVFAPLFATSRLLAMEVRDDVEQAGIEQVVLTSASSKTAIGAAWLLAHDDVAVVALTSSGNAAFCHSLGVYDDVVTYDEVDELPVVATTVLDLAGSAGVLDAVHHRLADDIHHSWIVGATHLDLAPASPHRPGPEARMFFAPSVLVRRREDGTMFAVDDGVQDDFLAWTDTWLTIAHRSGPTQVLAVYRDLLATGGDPAQAAVVSVSDAGA